MSSTVSYCLLLLQPSRYCSYITIPKHTSQNSFHCRRQSGMNFGYVTVNGVNSNVSCIQERILSERLHYFSTDIPVNLYFPFPYPETGSSIFLLTNSLISIEARVGFRPVACCTSSLPNATLSLNASYIF